MQYSVYGAALCIYHCKSVPGSFEECIKTPGD